MHEKNILFLLQCININNCGFDINQIIRIIKNFKQSSILTQLIKSFSEFVKLPQTDYKGQVEEKEKVIQNLKHKISTLKRDVNTPETLPKPENYEPNFYNACENNDLESIKYSIEVLGKNVKQCLKTTYHESPIEIACIKGYIDILKYFLSKGINIEERLSYGNTLLHIASKIQSTIDC